MCPAVFVPDKLVRFYGLGCQEASEADVEEEASQDAAAHPAPAPEQEVVESVVGQCNGPTTPLTFRALALLVGRTPARRSGVGRVRGRRQDLRPWARWIGGSSVDPGAVDLAGHRPAERAQGRG